MPRIEIDSIGPRELLENVLYGENTLRATENIDISPLKIGSEPVFIRALTTIKKVAAKANGEIGFVSPRRSEVITHVCVEIIGSQRHPCPSDHGAYSRTM